MLAILVRRVLLKKKVFSVTMLATGSDWPIEAGEYKYPSEYSTSQHYSVCCTDYCTHVNCTLLHSIAVQGNEYCNFPH